MKSEMARLTHEETTMKEKIKENVDRIKLNKQLPYLVSNVVEVIIFRHLCFSIFFVKCSFYLLLRLVS
jgi:ATP-dependent 26S proteasome regulatory subunit